MINEEWDAILGNEYEKDYFKNLIDFVNEEYEKKQIFPIKDDLYKALKTTSFSNVKVVILGQDPYHGDNEAHGYSFSVKEGIKTPPSLRNIFKELNNDLMIKRTKTNLEDWAKQGVLLINTIMTVEKDKPLSHQKKGWEIFTDNIIEKLGEKEEPTVFILMGNQAKTKKNLIKNKCHLIIETVHPSPLSASRGFFGSKIFSRTNNFLKENNIEQINW